MWKGLMDIDVEGGGGAVGWESCSRLNDTWGHHHLKLYKIFGTKPKVEHLKAWKL